jgi:hypothetical protein
LALEERTMIVAHTSYDPVTVILSGCAATLIGPGFHQLGQVTAGMVQTTLTTWSGRRILCFFGHGHHLHPWLYDQDRAAVLGALAPGALQGWVVYGACCHSLNGIATVLVGQGVTVIGFQGELLIPTEPRFVEGLGHCLRAVPLALDAGDTPMAAVQRARTTFQTISARLYAEAGDSLGEQLGVVSFRLNQRRLGLV